MKRAFFLFLLFFVGCASNYKFEYTNINYNNKLTYKTIPVYVDINFGETDKVSIENAINTWNYVLNNYIKFNIISFKFDMEPSLINKNSVYILRINHDSSFIPQASSNKPRGFCDSVGGNTVYIVRDNLTTEQVEFTTLHELGHILGALDIDGETLMNTRYSDKYSKCVDKISMELIAKIQHLDPNKLNYCFYN